MGIPKIRANMPDALVSPGLPYLVKEELILLLSTLLLAGISPNLFPVAQAGIASLSSLALLVYNLKMSTSF